jgi:DeoR/GlpR family transcriptional regulator of sugar metabolism
MRPEERQKRIFEHLCQSEFASLEELSGLVDASVSTTRRDLDFLQGEGLLRRTHGGARLVAKTDSEFAISPKSTPQFDEKEIIGEACAALIQPRQTVIVDAGTTCLLVARHLEDKGPNIVTNSLPVAQHFSGSNNFEVVVSGGLIYPKLGVLVGPLAVAAFGQVQADLAILSCAGVTPDGVTNSHSLLIEIQLAMIKAARQVVLCIDHTKFGRQSIARLCGLEVIDALITNQPPPNDVQIALSRADVELIVARPTATELKSPPSTTHTRVVQPPRLRRRAAPASASAVPPASPSSQASPPQSDVEPEKEFLD